jgi:hypothetical protein
MKCKINKQKRENIMYKDRIDHKTIVTDPVSGREVYVGEDFEDSGKTLEEYYDYHTMNFIRTRASIDELLKFANEVRVAGDGEIIDELLMSTPQDSSECLIANALNFSSSINEDYGPWGMYDIDESLIGKISSALGLSIVTETDHYNESENWLGVELPTEIANVAQAFDTFVDVELEQYDAMRFDNQHNPF